MEFKNVIENECSFDKPLKTEVCTPAEIVDQLKKTLKTGSSNMTGFGDKQAIELLKKKYNCSSESCVLNQEEVRREIGTAKSQEVLAKHFKPKGPKTGEEWLSNVEIDAVLAQISKRFPAFRHIPYQMIDFAQTKSELATFDFPAEYARGFRTFGTIINTDVSSGNGIHWFAIFGDFRTDRPTIEYFNSSGEDPMYEIHGWMHLVRNAWSPKCKNPIELVIASKTQYQYDTHSCGVYSLYYILSRLHDVPVSRFTGISDDLMHEFRYFLFRN